MDFWQSIGNFALNFGRAKTPVLKHSERIYLLLNELHMYTLSLHIEYLLLRHDCVVVPGVGAFINVRQSAWFDEEAGVWHPMTREVRFNAALKHDDGLLANSYARKEQTGFQEGRQLLHRTVAEMRHILEEEGELTLGNLGTLSNKEGKLTFIPRHTARQMSEAIGFTVAPVARVKAEEPTADEQPKTGEIMPQASLHPLVEQTAEAPDTGNETKVQAGENEAEETGTRRNFDTFHNYYIAVNKIFARAAACVALVAAVALSVFLPVSDCKREDRASVVPVERIIQTVRPEQPTTETPAETADITPADTDTARYHIIVATFTNRDDAEVFITTHSDCGYRLSICENGKRSRVSALASTDRSELEKEMRGDSIRSSFKQAWIWAENR